MSYKKTIELLNKLYSAEVEITRFTDPVGLGSMGLGELEGLKNQALESEVDYQKSRELKEITELSNYKKYFSAEHEKKKEIFIGFIDSDELYKSFIEERSEAAKVAQESMDDVYNKIDKAQLAIEKIIKETQQDIKDSLDTLKEIELNENYLLNSKVPINEKATLETGINRYVDYFDYNQVGSIDEYLSFQLKKRKTTSVLRHIDTLSRNSFKYNNFNTEEEILKGVSK